MSGLYREGTFRPSGRITGMKLFYVTCLAVSALGAQTFDAASIKPNRSGSGSSSTHGSTGMIRMENVPLKKLILMAYGVPDDRDYALEGPSWLQNERFDIVAKHPGETPQEQVRKMLQNLLAERFHLTLHPETRQLPTYTLVVAKDGLKIKAEEGGSSRTSGRPGKLEATKITLDKFANVLSRMTGRPVLNATGISGAFTFTLEWTPDETQRFGLPEGDAAIGRSLFGALQDQLGLKLEGKKAPAEILVVDRIDRTPTEN